MFAAAGEEAGAIARSRFDPGAGRRHLATQDDAQAWTSQHQVEEQVGRGREVRPAQPAASRLVREDWGQAPDRRSTAADTLGLPGVQAATAGPGRRRPRRARSSLSWSARAFGPSGTHLPIRGEPKASPFVSARPTGQFHEALEIHRVTIYSKAQFDG